MKPTILLVFALFKQSLAAIIDIGETSENATILPRAPRAPQNRGTFPLQCKGIEGACNNACYHIKCRNPASQRKTYIGPNMVKTAERNRRDAGTTSSRGGSTCRSYPFSQIMVDNQIASSDGAYNTDEWPMASSVQTPFAQRPPIEQPSLRCILEKENDSSGSKFKAFEHDQGMFLQQRDSACKGVLIAGDSYLVTFNLVGANQAELNHCIDLNARRMNQNCDDYHQARLTSKPTQDGKISVPYNPFRGSLGMGSDNRYLIEYGNRPEMMQCSVEYIRTEHNEVQARVVNWENTNQLRVRTNYPNGRHITTLTGLPFDLVVTSSGALGSNVQFVYGNQNTANNRISYFDWDLNSGGAGVGGSSSSLTNYKYCKVEKDTVQYNPQDTTYNLGLPGDPRPTAIKGLRKQNIERILCYFPCFTTAVL